MIAYESPCGDPDCPFFGEHTAEDHPQLEEIAREESVYEPR